MMIIADTKKGENMNPVVEKIERSLETFLSTLKRFPLASLSALVLTIIALILMDEHNHESPNIIIASKVAFVVTLGIVLFPALQLLGHSTLFPLIGLFLLALYYYDLPPNIKEMTHSASMRHILLWIGLFFTIIWAPFVGKKSNNETFWHYAQTILFGLTTSIFFSLLLYGGLATALFAIEKLFHFELERLRYGQLALTVFGIFGINLFLSQIPKHPLYLEPRSYSNAKKIFTKNLLAPIALIYFIILFAYTAKILWSLAWPEGVLSWIIIAFSMVAIVTYLFLTPYLKNSSLTQRLIWLAILLQTIMLGMALWMRIEAYGITYNRYLLSLFSIWLALMSLYFILFGKAQQKWLFFFASLFIFVSQFGPYSATNLSKQNQSQQLIKLIKTAHPRSEALEIKTKYEISNRLAYIENHYGVETFKEITPHILEKYKRSKKDAQEKELTEPMNYPYTTFAVFATQELGFKFIDRWEWLSYQRNNIEPPKEDYYFYAPRQQQSVNIKGYARLIKYAYAPYMEKSLIVSEASTLRILFKNNRLTLLNEDNNKTVYDLNAYTQTLLKNKKSVTEKRPDLLVYEESNNSSQIKILFEHLTVSPEGNITDFSSQILLKP